MGGLVGFTRHAPHQRPTHMPRTSTLSASVVLQAFPWLSFPVCRVSGLSCLLSLVCPVLFRPLFCPLSVLSCFCLSSVCPCLSVSIGVCLSAPCVCGALRLKEFHMCASFRVCNCNVQAQRKGMFGYVHLQPSVILRVLEERAQVSRPERW